MLPKLPTIHFGLQFGGDFWPLPKVQWKRNEDGIGFLVGWLYIGFYIFTRRLFAKSRLAKSLPTK